MKFNEEELDAASSYLAEVLAENPKDSAALMLSGRIALKEEDYTKAVNDFRSVLKDQPDSVEVHTLLAVTYQASGEVELAEESLRQAVDVKPDDVGARLRLAAFVAGNGDLDKAMEQIDAALDSDPESVLALRAKAELLAKQGGNEEELEEVLTALEAASPETGIGAFGKGRLFKSQKKYDAALVAYEDALEREPDSILLLSEMVDTEILMGKPDRAVTRINKVLEARPDHQTAHFLLGSAYMAKKDFARAEAEFEKQLAISPDNRIVYQRMAVARRAQGSLDGAIEAVQQGLEVLPGDAALLQTLSNLYIQQGEMEKAASAYQDALKASPDNRSLLLGLAGVRERQGQFEDAITIYEKLIQTNPENAIVVNNLAALLADHRTDEASLNKAMELARKLSASNQPALLDTLGWVHYRLGEYDQAASVLSGVVEQAPDVPVFRYHLGMTYYKQGDNRAAKEILSKAVAEDVKYDGVEEARRVYKEIGGG